MTARGGLTGLVAALSVLPLAGCIVAVDGGGKKGLEKRIERLERRVHRMEKERGLLPEFAPPAGQKH